MVLVSCKPQTYVELYKLKVHIWSLPSSYHSSTLILFLCVIDILVHIALHRPITARRVRVEPTARLDCDLGRLLHRLHREIFGRLDDDRSLATDPRNNGGPVFVIMASTRLVFLAATTRTAPQGLLPALLGLALLTRGVVEVIRFDGPFPLTLHCIGQRSIAQPPAPPITGADMDPHLPRNTP